MVVEDDREPVLGEGGHDGVVDLQGRPAAQLWIGGDGHVRHGCCRVDHLVGERQPDAVDAEFVEVGEQFGQRGTVEAEGDAVGVLAGVVVGGVGDAAASGP
jgi:hypothetical protein